MHAKFQGGRLPAPPAFGPASVNFFLTFGASLDEFRARLTGTLPIAVGVEGPLGFFLGPASFNFTGAGACGGAMLVCGLLFSRMMFGDGLWAMKGGGRRSGISVVRTREEGENWSLPVPTFLHLQ